MTTSMEKPSEPREPELGKPSGGPGKAAPAPSPRALTRARRRQAVVRFWQQYRTHRAGLVGLAVLAVIALLALTAPAAGGGRFAERDRRAGRPDGGAQRRVPARHRPVRAQSARPDAVGHPGSR
ncbi:hypothetical protein SCALM49S_04485 [Streptomyces californicus]